MLERASLLQSQKLILTNGAILQITVWRLPSATPERGHGLNYSLFYGRPGERIVGYDNEAGKGDHRHYREREEPYAFVTLDRMMEDFLADVRMEMLNE